jgi:hypothetical protein
MRKILLALIVLAFAMPAAEAARRNDETRTTASRSAQQQSATAQQARSSSARETAARGNTRQQASSSRTSRQQASSRSTARSTSTTASRNRATSRNARETVALRPGDARTSRGGIVVRGASAAAVPRAAAQNCTRRNGRTRCTPAVSSVAGWQNGLPPTDHAQRDCPSGTFATLARGHDDVVRCMPF